MEPLCDFLAKLMLVRTTPAWEICPVSAEDVLPVSAADICLVSAEDLCLVLTADICLVATADSRFGPKSSKNEPKWVQNGPQDLRIDPRECRDHFQASGTGPAATKSGKRSKSLLFGVSRWGYRLI